MRDGLREYWRENERNCDVSMSLLSTADARLRVMLCELVTVILCGTRARIYEAWRAGRFSLLPARSLLALSRVMIRHAEEALRST